MNNMKCFIIADKTNTKFYHPEISCMSASIEEVPYVFSELWDTEDYLKALTQKAKRLCPELDWALYEVNLQIGGEVDEYKSTTSIALCKP